MNILKRVGDFLEHHKKLVLFDIFLVVMSYGIRVFSANVSVDTDLFMTHPFSNYNWLDIGRWGLVLLKKIVNKSGFSVYYEGIMAFIVIVLFLLAYAFLFDSLSNKKYNYYIFSALFITHPIFVFQWFFKLQAFEIALSILFIPISLYFIFEWLENKKIINIIVASILMLVSFSCYQTNVILYISSAIICYILKYNDLKGFKENGIICLKLILSFLSVYLLNTMITKLFFTSSSYLSDTVLWDFSHIQNNIHLILFHVKEVLLGSYVLNKAYFIGCSFLVILFVIKIKQLNKQNIFNWICLGCFILTPFLLSLYMGSNPFYRSQYVLPFVIGCMYMHIYKEFSSVADGKKLFIIQTIIVLICGTFTMKQIKVTNKLWYSDDVRYQQDCQMLSSIIDDLHDQGIDYNHKPTVFIGTWRAPLNPQCFVPIETIGYSYFENAATYQPYYFFSNDSIKKLALMQGETIAACDVEQCNQARKYSKNMTSYPQKGYIQEYDDLIVIKLSDDVIKD